MAGIGEVVGWQGATGFWRGLCVWWILLGNIGKPEVARGEPVIHVLENSGAVLEGELAVGACGSWHGRVESAVGVFGNFHIRLLSAMSQHPESEPLTRFTKLLNELLPVTPLPFYQVRHSNIGFL